MRSSHRLTIFLGLALIGASPSLAPVPPPAAEVRFDVKDAPLKGPPKAPIQVVEFADFLCPSCRHVADAFRDYVPHSGNRLAIYFKFFPLDGACSSIASLHPGACLLSYGGVCAQQQGKFWPYHDKVFSLQPEYALKPPDGPGLVTLSAEIGLDAKAFETCLASPRTKEQVAANIEEGRLAGVTGTPSFFVNGRRLARTNEFLEAVDLESKRLGLGPMPALP